MLEMLSFTICAYLAPLKSLHSRDEILFGKGVNLKLETPLSCARSSEGFRGEYSSLNYVQDVYGADTIKERPESYVIFSSYMTRFVPSSTSHAMINITRS
jgi:hypothetical protein